MHEEINSRGEKRSTTYVPNEYCTNAKCNMHVATNAKINTSMKIKIRTNVKAK